MNCDMTLFNCIYYLFVYIIFATYIDAWIVTGGTRAGVMEIVGETILDYMLQTGGTQKRITALGIASWGFVANKQALVSPDV